MAFCLFSVYALGGCSDLCVQSGEWDQLPGCVQSLRQDGAVPRHQGDSPYTCWHTGSVAFFISLYNSSMIDGHVTACLMWTVHWFMFRVHSLAFGIHFDFNEYFQLQAKTNFTFLIANITGKETLWLSSCVASSLMHVMHQVNMNHFLLLFFLLALNQRSGLSLPKNTKHLNEVFNGTSYLPLSCWLNN